MDEVLEQLETTDISPDGVDPEPEIDHVTNYDGLYKNWGKLSNQEQRRKSTLAIQKKNRNDKLDISRGILQLVSSVEDDDLYYQDTYRPSIYVAGFTRTSLTYKNVLMISEWLIEKPEDFETNWFVVPCPKGVRTLAVAYQGCTRFFNKFGVFKMARRTALPGGNPQDSCHRDHYIVLDGFYVESLNKLFVLDVLAWKNQPMTNGETDFRHFWVKNQMEEIPELKTISKKNKVLFELLPKIPCSTESFNEFMMKVPFFDNYSPPLDGLLFYHQKANYISGVTPLVGWLYPYMVNEVLGAEITVNPLYTLSKPRNYTSQAEYIQKFDAKHNKRRRSAKNKEETMDTSTEVDQTQDGGNGDPAQNETGTAPETTEIAMDAEDKCENGAKGTVECTAMDAEAEIKPEKTVHCTNENVLIEAEKDVPVVGTNETTSATDAKEDTELKSEMCTDDGQATS